MGKFIFLAQFSMVCPNDAKSMIWHSDFTEEYWIFEEAEERILSALEDIRDELDQYNPGWVPEEVEYFYSIYACVRIYNLQCEIEEDDEWINKLQEIYKMPYSDEEKWKLVFENSRRGEVAYNITGKRESEIGTPTEGWNEWLSRYDFFISESKFKKGDVVIDENEHVYVVSKEQSVITEINNRDALDCHFYGLEGIDAEGNYSFVLSDMHTDEKKLKPYLGEIQEGTLLDIFIKIVSRVYPPLCYVLEDYFVDTGYNKIVSYRELFELDGVELL